MNKYTFVVTTEGIGANEEIADTEFSISDTTPHEAWKQLFTMMAGLEENDSVILSIKLL
jgi:hypothetical protein